MYCIESLLGRFRRYDERAAAKSTRLSRRGRIGAAELFLPGQERVVHLEEAAADPDRPLHALRRQPGVDVAEAAVERLRPFVRRAHGQAEPAVAAFASLALRLVRERRRHAAPPMLGPPLHVAELGWVRDREVRVPERLLALPRDEV